MHRTNAKYNTNPNKLKTKAIIKQKAHVTNILDLGSKIFTNMSAYLYVDNVCRKSVHSLVEYPWKYCEWKGMTGIILIPIM